LDKFFGKVPELGDGAKGREDAEEELMPLSFNLIRGTEDAPRIAKGRGWS